MKPYKSLFLSIMSLTIFSPPLLHSEETQPNYNATNTFLNIPRLRIGNDLLSVKLLPSDLASLTFKVSSANLLPSYTNRILAAAQADFDASTGILSIAQLTLENTDFALHLNLVNADTLEFQVDTNSVVSTDNLDNLTFTELDTRLAQRNVSTNTPMGIWIIYSHANSHFFEDYSDDTTKPDSTEFDATNKLKAFVVSLYLIDDNGNPRIELAPCTGSFYENKTLVEKILDSNSNITQFSLPFSQLNKLFSDQAYGRFSTRFRGSDGWGIHASHDIDITTAAANKEVNITLLNNREMVFSTDYTYADTEGSQQGTYVETFKGRKISDNIMSDLGTFKVNDAIKAAHCYAYDQKSFATTRITSRGTQKITQPNKIISVISRADTSSTLTGFTYESQLPPLSFTTNGQPTTPMYDEVVHRVTVGSRAISADIPANKLDDLEIIINQESVLGLKLNFAIFDNGVETKQGSMNIKL
ncbi:MAG: hypothetical protein methR_P0723 [Methyloprofundus sp.]|nr:MAG: hypothetical protein methR_P0723 [Methyloprofundus sp.]